MSAIERLVGEFHLHEFPAAGHAAADFIDAPRPVSSIHGDGLIELTTYTAFIDGPCALYPVPTCHTACDAGHYCAGPDRCDALPAVHFIDGGAFEVTGSRPTPSIWLRYAEAGADYESIPPAGTTPIFDGGERLRIRGGVGDYAIDTVIDAPVPVVPISPAAGAEIHFPPTGPLALQWAPVPGSTMLVALNASNASGAFAVVRCLADDTGALEVSARILARLPAAPRSIRIEIERDNQQLLPVALPGAGVLVHAIWSYWWNGQD